MSASTPHRTSEIESTRWRINPARSNVEFHVPHFYRLHTVTGWFERYTGILCLSRDPAIELTIEADSLNSNNPRRDEHLRSSDFFDAEHHPQVRFVSDSAELDGERLNVRGRLYAAGKSIPLEVDGTLRRDGDELEIDATAWADQRKLGMTWSPLGMVRTPSRLTVRGRLVKDGG